MTICCRQLSFLEPVYVRGNAVLRGDPYRVLYPTNYYFFFTVSHDVLWYLLELFTVLHLAIAGMTMFYLCRCFSASRNSSLFAAVQLYAVRIFRGACNPFPYPEHIGLAAFDHGVS